MREVDNREVLAMLSAGAQIVDVLPAQEYNPAHIKGAVHIPRRAPATVMNSAPQTIRPDMTPRLAANLLESNRYLIVTTEQGKYLGRYLSITPSPEMSR